MNQNRTVVLSATKTSEVAPKLEKERPVRFTLIKNYRGGLAIEINSYNFLAPTRTIRMNWNENLHYLPADWALGVFVTPSALRQLEKGYFTFENLDILIEMAEEKGFFVPEAIKKPKINAHDIKKVLLTNDIEALKRLMLNANSVNISDLVAVARAVLPRLTNNLVDYIESTYKIRLEVVNLD